MAVREVMDQQEVHIIHESFTIDIRCKITWAILTKGWSFFNRVLVNNHFTQAELFLWTTSLIRQTADNVQYTKEIVHPSYPAEWMVGTGKQGSLLPVVHKGQFCIPTNAAGGGGRPVRDHTSGLACSYPVGDLLAEWSQYGCPTAMGKNWTRDEMQAAINRGPHKSALVPAALKHFKIEVAEKVKKG